MKNEVDTILLKNSIRLLISGFLNDNDMEEDNSLFDVPDILREIAQDYDDELKKFSDSLEGI